MRFILLFILLVCGFYSFSQDTIRVNDLSGKPTKDYCGPFRTLRKNGTVKSEYFDNYNGNRIYYFYTGSGKLKRTKHLYNVEWVRNYVPLCLKETNDIN